MLLEQCTTQSDEKEKKKHQVRCHLVSEIRTHNKFNGGGGGGGGDGGGGVREGRGDDFCK